MHLELAGIERVDDVKELWLDLHHHHGALVGAVPLVDDDELSWQRRRALYLERLGLETGFLILAVEQDVVVGFALVCIEQAPDDTFPVGEQYAELYSLSVAAQRRGRGIGTRLLDFVDRVRLSSWQATADAETRPPVDRRPEGGSDDRQPGREATVRTAEPARG